jgi:hypothetical protein
VIPTSRQPNNPADYAHRRYALLRKLDALHLQALYIEIAPDPHWSAVRDRLTRVAKALPA